MRAFLGKGEDDAGGWQGKRMDRDTLTSHKGGLQAAKSLQGQLNRIRNGTFRGVALFS